MIQFKQTGDFKKLSNFLEKSKEVINVGMLDKYGREGVIALSAATPVDSGLTASSWYYKITHDKGNAKLAFYNSNIQNGALIAILLQYGHGTNNGGWIEGRDYINPAAKPVFDNIASRMWKEVCNG